MNLVIMNMVLPAIPNKNDDSRIEMLAQDLHEAVRKVKHGGAEWDNITEDARDKLRMQAKYIISIYPNLTRK